MKPRHVLQILLFTLLLGAVISQTAKQTERLIAEQCREVRSVRINSTNFICRPTMGVIHDY